MKGRKMIDYSSLIPFKVNCKTIRNSFMLQKALFKQGFKWKDSGQNQLIENTLLFVNINKIISKVNNSLFNLFEKHESKEICIERLLVSPLKKFLKEKKK